MSDETISKGVSRRSLLGTSATRAVAGGAGGSAAALAPGSAPRPARAQEAGSSPHVAPGELDEYYVFTSGGHSGEIRIVGLPSMRELMRIPVFNREQRHRLGPDQREPPGADRGPDARDRASSWPTRAGST